MTQHSSLGTQKRLLLWCSVWLGDHGSLTGLVSSGAGGRGWRVTASLWESQSDLARRLCGGRARLYSREGPERDWALCAAPWPKGSVPPSLSSRWHGWHQGKGMGSGACACCTGCRACFFVQGQSTGKTLVTSACRGAPCGSRVAKHQKNSFTPMGNLRADKS